MKHMFEFPVVPAVLVSAFLLGSGCYYFRTRSPFLAVFDWLWAFVMLGLGAVDLFMEQRGWPSLATLLVAGVCEALLLVFCVATPLANKNMSKGRSRTL